MGKPGASGRPGRRNGGDDPKPPFRFGKVEYNDVELYRPYKVQSPCSSHKSGQKTMRGILRAGKVNFKNRRDQGQNRIPQNVRRNLLLRGGAAAPVAAGTPGHTRAAAGTPGRTRAAVGTPGRTRAAAGTPGRTRDAPAVVLKKHVPKPAIPNADEAGPSNANVTVEEVAVPAVIPKSALRKRGAEAQEGQRRTVRFRSGTRTSLNRSFTIDDPNRPPIPNTPVISSPGSPPAPISASARSRRRDAGSTPYAKKSIVEDDDEEPVEEVEEVVVVLPKKAKRSEKKAAAPEESIPKETAPEESAPKETAPEEPAPAGATGVRRSSRRLNSTAEPGSGVKQSPKTSPARNSNAGKKSLNVSRRSRKSIMPTDAEFIHMYDEVVDKLSTYRRDWEAVLADVEENYVDGPGKVTKEDLVARIKEAVWSAEAFIKKKLGMFKGYLDDKMNNVVHAEGDINPSDLKGLWDTCENALDGVYGQYTALEALKARDWKEKVEAPKQKMAKGNPRIGKAAPKRKSTNKATKAKGSGLQALIQAARKKKMEKDAGSSTEDDIIQLVQNPKPRRASRKSKALTESNVEGAAAPAANSAKKPRASRGARKSSTKKQDVPAVEVGLFEEILDDVETKIGTLTGRAEVADIREESEDEENYSAGKEIIPSPSEIGLHPTTPGERAFDMLARTANFQHGTKSAKKGAKDALKEQNEGMEGSNVIDTPRARRATRSNMK